MIGIVAMAGCGGDGDGPTSPPNNTEYDTFTEEAAVVQAQTAAPQAVALVSQITSMAVGFVKKGGTYGWSETNQRWEWDYSADEEGYVYDIFYTVQYLNGSIPQQSPIGADTVHHNMIGTMNFDISDEGYHIVYDYMYAYDTIVTGLGTETYTMMGSGQHQVAYDYTGEGYSESANYTASWEILDDGIQVGAGGCPAGTIRYTFGSFYTDVVFNGTGTVTYTTYNGAGGVVAGGGGTYSTFCQT